MKLDQFESSIDKTDLTIWKMLKWFFIAALVLGAFGVIGSYVGLFGQVATTPAALISKTIQPDNIINNYEWFYDTNAAYQAKLGQIVTHKSIIKETTEEKEISRLRIELAAMQQMCRELVTRYDANATKVNRGLFKGREAPAYLEISTCE